MSAGWPKVPLGQVLSYRKEVVTIDDLTNYKRPRVQLHAQGIVLRDEVLGALIKTKKQQVCRSGDFLIAEIDAKVGGFGIVPDVLAGAIVSSHYFLFDVIQRKMDRKFLDYFIRTPAFREQVEAQGSTNYAAIRPADVLTYEIPLPPIEEQRRIVARIEALAAEIDHARALRQQAAEEAEAFVTSLHVQLSGSRIKKLGDILELDEDRIPIHLDREYPQVGLRSFGNGLFGKNAVRGSETTYKNFNTLRAGCLVLSQVKGWEGAVAICSAHLAGWYASPEYRTFRCDPSAVRPEYLSKIVCCKWFWGRLEGATRGVGARRERTRPEQFLEIQLPWPDLDAQRYGESLLAEVDRLKALQAETAAEIDALLPAILDRAFKGELLGPA